MNKKREIPVVEINSSFIPRHSKESFQYELNKESGLISLQLSPDNEYPLRSFRYIRDFCYREGTSAPDPSFLVGCSCPSKCESSSCFCISTNHSSKAPYINHCLNTEDFSMVECNLKCACGPSCPNRVAQKGVQIKIVLKYIKNKGWSVFANQNVSKGAFITEYLGELLTQTEAKKREEKLIEKKMPLFLFDMDFYDADLNHKI
ncbi:hypothetical protein HMI56_003863 [Coelomomyces lativittatus]|nr:hypothetical protein HMI56_003863 [Coelomomyces lativittatus]